MSISERLDETLDTLDLTSAAADTRASIISRSMKNLKDKMSGLDIEIELERPEVVVEEPKAHYEKTELADVARSVYRESICPRDEKTAEDREKTDGTPSTIASRANMKALARSLAGLRSSGNEGKTSHVGPNGTGNEGKLSPTGANGVGNVSNQLNNYYALTTDMTLEEYEKYVQNIFEEDEVETVDEACWDSHKQVGMKKKGGKMVPNCVPKNEDVVHELETRLVTMGSADWIVVDQILREFAQELDVTPRTLSREFKSIHGVYPDKWIKENLDVEVCGYMPLDEASRLNKIGGVYEVTFMFRGGTNRLKFFWPMPGKPSKEDMQREVEKFWPKGRVIAFYPTIDNEMNSNYMVMTPPMTENYHFMDTSDWHEMTEESVEVLDLILEEEGEPISPIMNEENGYTLYIEDYQTGEERQVFFNEEGLRDWFGKSKSKDGKSGWVNVVTGGTCASDEPGEGTPKCVSSSKRASMSEAERKSAARRKKAADPNQQSKSGAAKPTYVKTDKDKTKKEEVDFELSEESDKKGKGSGSKDACYHKVKSRYSVWPSAYASGALVKCRKVGAANWGNSSKKEEVDYKSGMKGMAKSLLKSADKHTKQAEVLRKNGLSENEMYIPGESDPESNPGIDEACWKGYEKKGMKTMFGKRYPNCVKKEEVEQLDEISAGKMGRAANERFKRARKAEKAGDTVGAEKQMEKGYKNYDRQTAKHKSYMDKIAEGKSDAWQRSEGKNKSGGLNEKGRKSYEKANPGSDLKAPSKKVGNPRRKSFCARMKGMKSKLTSAKTANDPDSRINKSLRAWNC